MFNNRRVEEDLERIRRANLPRERRDSADKKEKRARDASKEDLRFSFKDIFAMTIAVFSLLLPYVLIIGGVVVVALLLFIR